MGFEGGPLLSLVIFLPLLGAVVVLFLPRGEGGLHKGTALVTSIVTFLDRCASVTEAPEYGSLTIHERGKFSPPGYQHEPFVAAATAAFGPGDRQVGVRMFPDTGYAEYKHEWRVPSHAIDRAIEVVAAGPPSASKTVPPISLSLAWTFRLLDLQSGNLLPPVAPPSRLHLFLATAPSANFDLNFPFERPDAAFL